LIRVHIRAADANINAHRRLDAVITVDTADVFWPAVFLDPVVLKRGSVIDPLTLDCRRIDSGITGGLERCVRHRHRLACRRGRGGSGGAARIPGRFEYGVSHAAALTIEHDVFDDAHLRPIRSPDF